MKFFLHAAGSRAVHSKLFDFKRGFELLRDLRVAAGLKLLALAGGIAITIVLELCEAPLEAIAGVLLPVVGPALDLAVDGIEFLIVPLFIAAALLVRMVPIERIPARVYRSGPPPLPR